MTPQEYRKRRDEILEALQYEAWQVGQRLDSIHESDGDFKEAAAAIDALILDVAAEAKPGYNAVTADGRDAGINEYETELRNIVQTEGSKK